MNLPGGRRLDVLRREYGARRLTEDSVDVDPMTQFAAWLADAVGAAVVEPHALVVSTSDSSGVVTARTVLLKAVDPRGFVFATNYRSQKGQAIAANPQVALTFHWRELERQVCISGTARRTTAAESDAIFADRPREARLASYASAQSEVLADREELEARVAEVAARFEGVDVPRPRHWGGFLVVPTSVELWQGGAARLHDRLRYRRVGRRWVLERLSP